MSEIITRYQASPVEVTGCPSSHKGPIMIIYAKEREPEEIILAPGVYSRNPAELIGFGLSCGCFVSNRNFELIYMSGRLPYFNRREKR